MDVLHKCDTPPCVNPDHLFLGSHADNMGDASTKGRMHPGTRHGNARLTEADVMAIRTAHSEGVTQSALASRYGIVQGQVTRIVDGRQWKSLPVMKKVGRRRGELAPSAKLTEADVRAIRLRAGDDRTTVAHDFGVSVYTINDIVSGRTWKHVV